MKKNSLSKKLRLYKSSKDPQEKIGEKKRSDFRRQQSRKSHMPSQIFEKGETEKRRKGAANQQEDKRGDSAIAETVKGAAGGDEKKFQTSRWFQI